MWSRDATEEFQFYHKFVQFDAGRKEHINSIMLKRHNITIVNKHFHNFVHDKRRREDGDDKEFIFIFVKYSRKLISSRKVKWVRLNQLRSIELINNNSGNLRAWFIWHWLSS